MRNVFSFKRGKVSHTLPVDVDRRLSFTNLISRSWPLEANSIISFLALSGMTVAEAIVFSSVLVVKTFTPQYYKMDAHACTTIQLVVL